MVGQNIKQMRELKGWSQEQLARMMGYKSKSTINKIEKNINDVNQTTLDKFAKIFKCEITDLLSNDPVIKAVLRHESALSEEYIKQQVYNSLNLTEDEYGLIIAFRKADTVTQDNILKLLDIKIEEKNEDVG